MLGRLLLVGLLLRGAVPSGGSFEERAHGEDAAIAGIASPVVQASKQPEPDRDSRTTLGVLKHYDRGRTSAARRSATTSLLVNCRPREALKSRADVHVPRRRLPRLRDDKPDP